MRCMYCNTELNDTALICYQCGKVTVKENEKSSIKEGEKCIIKENEKSSTKEDEKCIIKENKKSSTKEDENSTTKVNTNKYWIYFVGGIFLVAVFLMCMNMLFKHIYAATKYLPGIVKYINAGEYWKALEYYDNNPYLEKDDKNQMDSDELQLLALYYYADYLNYVKNISEEEMASLEQYETKYNNVIDMEGYLCSSALKNIDAIHDEVTSCQYIADKVDECYALIWEGVDLMQDTREAFLNKRKSMKERCEAFSVKELNDLYQAENGKWKEHIVERDKAVGELQERAHINLLLNIYIDTQDDIVNLPGGFAIDMFYDYGDEFFKGAEKWISKVESNAKEQHSDYRYDSEYTYRYPEEVQGALPYDVCWVDLYLCDQIEELKSTQELFDAGNLEGHDKIKKDAFLLGVRISRNKLQTDILLNLEEIYILEDDTKGLEQGNGGVNSKESESGKAIKDAIQDRIVVNPGDTVTGTIEKRFIKADEEIGGVDMDYYVLRFSEPVDLAVWDIEQKCEIVVEKCDEIPIYAPYMGNVGNLDLEPYVGRNVSCWIYASTTGTRIELSAEVANLKIIETDIKRQGFDNTNNQEYYKQFAEYAYMTNLSVFLNTSYLTEENALKMFIILNAIEGSLNEQVYYDEQTGMCQVDADVVERVIREKTDFMDDDSWGKINWKTTYSEYNRIIYEQETETFYYLPDGEYFSFVADEISKIEVMQMSSGYISVNVFWNSGFYQDFIFCEMDPKKISSYSTGKM